MIEINIDQQTRANCDRFKQKEVASKYPSQYRIDNKRDQREKKAILRCLQHIPRGAHVLDFPCGTGRLINLLHECGYQVSGADSAASMIALASCNPAIGNTSESEVPFYESDVFDSGFDNGQFDAVVCNRLFHHFVESKDRQAALTELRRISSGPIVVSFFNSFSTSMSYRKLRKFVQGQPIQDRTPVSLNRLAREARACGLEISYSTPSRWGISPLWYVVFKPAA
ncbi:MAG: class I SAM-dependent methyltransferase [Akkermansiaceae bacterium]|nr:class I SAM-dependent methyltransferase [Akkermansiaceae bacterium]